MPKIEVKAKYTAEVIDFDFKREELVIETGGFDDISYYGKLATVADVYRLQINGGVNSNGVVIPSRNPLPNVVKYARSQSSLYGKIYGATKDLMTAGLTIGLDINSRHRLFIESFSRPRNAPTTIKKKGFDNPLIHTEKLVNSIFFSINGEGRYS